MEGQLPKNTQNVVWSKTASKFLEVGVILQFYIASQRTVSQSLKRTPTLNVESNAMHCWALVEALDMKVQEDLGALVKDQRLKLLEVMADETRCLLCLVWWKED